MVSRPSRLHLGRGETSGLFHFYAMRVLLLLTLCALAPAAWAQSVACTGACTVTHVLTPDPQSLSPERVADYMDLFWSFVFVIVTAWGLRQILNIFSRDNET